MPEKSLNEIPRDLRELYQKGTAALQRNNLDYAIAIFEQILKREPALFECRQALRASQFKKVGGQTSFFKKMLGGATSSPLVAKGQVMLMKNPLDAIQIAEQILNGDPSNGPAHKILAEGAMASDLPKTACLSLEILLKHSPKDYDLNMKYGAALAQAGQVAKAETVYTDLQRTHPNKGEIAQALKDLSARTTLKEGGYDALADGSGSYRDILKNKDEAVKLEQEGRHVKSEDAAANLIAEYETRRKTEPNNLKLLRNLAELYTQKKEFDKALGYYEEIRTSESGNDPSLDRAIAETTLRKFDHQLSQLDPAAPELAEQRKAIQAERDSYQLAECKTRAENYPTDLQIRFELGELYFKAGQMSEAIQEFQKAQNYPAKRLQAMRFLGQCFAKRGMNDMAARKFQDAIKEKPGFDDEKKELIYQLGSVYEKMGKKEEAIEQFKIIYEEDIGYKDVGAKVDAYYASQG
jgi:tetratricopeptide (TPR) repeat protein